MKLKPHLNERQVEICILTDEGFQRGTSPDPAERHYLVLGIHPHILHKHGKFEYFLGRPAEGDLPRIPPSQTLWESAMQNRACGEVFLVMDEPKKDDIYLFYMAFKMQCTLLGKLLPDCELYTAALPKFRSNVKV